jgi:hypothetical protein
MSKLLDDLFQSFGSGLPELTELTAKIEQLDAAIIPNLADEARESYKRALNQQRIHQAFFASFLASSLYLKLGQKKPALEAHFGLHQALFLEATTVEAYRRVHEGARDIVLKARDIQQRDLMFQARVLAADTAYFASQAAGNDTAQKEKWLATALDDLCGVFAERPDAAKAGIWSDQLMSSLSATVQELEKSGLDKKPEILSALRQLAGLVKAHVPADFNIPGDAEKTEYIARGLRSLSSRLGDR